MNNISHFLDGLDWGYVFQQIFKMFAGYLVIATSFYMGRKYGKYYRKGKTAKATATDYFYGTFNVLLYGALPSGAISAELGVNYFFIIYLCISAPALWGIRVSFKEEARLDADKNV